MLIHKYLNVQMLSAILIDSIRNSGLLACTRVYISQQQQPSTSNNFKESKRQATQLTSIKCRGAENSNNAMYWHLFEMLIVSTLTNSGCCSCHDFSIHILPSSKATIKCKQSATFSCMYVCMYLCMGLNVLSAYMNEVKCSVMYALTVSTLGGK